MDKNSASYPKKTEDRAFSISDWLLCEADNESRYTESQAARQKTGKVVKTGMKQTLYVVFLVTRRAAILFN